MSEGESEIGVLFVSGFHRSGTTLVTAAVTQAMGATTLTVGDLARHIPSLERFVRSAATRQQAPDRGVDRLAVTASTPEEYGWLLRYRCGGYSVADGPGQALVLRQLYGELAARPGTSLVVLKNPWDTGHERSLLDLFPQARIVLVRRDLRAMEDSMHRAWERYVSSSSYLRALIGDRTAAAGLLGVLMNPASRAAMVRRSRRRVRLAALRLAITAHRLPLDRVAFVSYDELRTDPLAGAWWASHVLDHEAFAQSVSAHTFAEYNRDGSGGVVVRLLDGLLAQVWRRARARQIEAGVLTR